MIRHEGDTPYSGHYKTNVKGTVTAEMKALEAASAWRLHNDARVSEMSERTVLEECETAGYLLFYVFSSVATSAAVPTA